MSSQREITPIDTLRHTERPPMSHCTAWLHICNHVTVRDRVHLATTLAASGCSDPEIQALCRWQTAESLKIYKRFQPDQVCKMLDRAQGAKVESYTAANLPTISSYQIAAGIHAWNV